MILPAVAVNIQAHSDANIVVKLLGDKLMTDLLSLLFAIVILIVALLSGGKS